MSEPKPDLGLLEEDDEFEEFPAEDWAQEEEDAADVNVWEDNWDDDNVEDDFSKQLSVFRTLKQKKDEGKQLCGLKRTFVKIAELDKQGKNADGSENMKS